MRKKKTVNIIIVDDNNDNLNLLTTVLNEAGYGVRTAKNGSAALELARRTPPGLVITDILMPVMDGFELCRSWKADARLKRIPLIFYTATYTDPRAQRFALSLGADRFVIKTGKIDVLEAAVREVLAQGHSGTGGAPAKPQTSKREELKEYNEVIFGKLQDKVAQLGAASLEVKNKKQELADFFCITSQELRTPLTNIKGFSENLLGYSGEVFSLVKAEGKESARLNKLLGEKIPEALRFIVSGVENMHAIIDGLLKVARFGSVEMKPKPVDMNKLVSDAVKNTYFQLKEAGAEVKIGDLPACVADPDKLVHVFCNLIDNAIQYRDPLRKLVIEISGGRLGSGACSYTVSDNGRGLTPEEEQGKIWEFFHRPGPQGEGVGLTISKQIIEKHGGSIKALRAQGGGAAFTLELPGPGEGRS